MVPAKVTPTTTPPALNPYRYAEKKIQRVAISFTPHSPNTRMACHIADTVDDASLYRIGYCQDGQEMREDYFGYVYDNSFARRMRRKRYD